MSEEKRLTKKDIPDEMRPSKWGARIGIVLISIMSLAIFGAKVVLEGEIHQFLFIIPFAFLGALSGYYHEINILKNFSQNYDKYTKEMREENPLRYRYLVDRWLVLMWCFSLASAMLMQFLVIGYFKGRSDLMDTIAPFFFANGILISQLYVRYRFYNSLPDG